MDRTLGVVGDDIEETGLQVLRLQAWVRNEDTVVVSSRPVSPNTGAVRLERLGELHARNVLATGPPDRGRACAEAVSEDPSA